MDKDITDFPRIETGNGIDRNFAATTNDRLERTVKALVAIDKTFDTIGTNISRSVLSLEKTIKSLDVKNEKLQKSIYTLTIVTVILALIQVITAVIAILK